MHPTHIPLRVATGAFILNSGIGKLGADEETAAGLHGMAAGAYPVFEDVEPQLFARLLAYGEIALGAALLLPKVPSAAAGVGLAGFGASLVGLYLRTPGLTEEDGIRPSPDGVPIAKDVWLVGAGLTLATQGALSGVKSAAKASRKAAAERRKELTKAAAAKAKEARAQARSAVRSA